MEDQTAVTTKIVILSKLQLPYVCGFHILKENRDNYHQSAAYQILQNGLYAHFCRKIFWSILLNINLIGLSLQFFCKNICKIVFFFLICTSFEDKNDRCYSPPKKIERLIKFEMAIHLVARQCETKY